MTASEQWSEQNQEPYPGFFQLIADAISKPPSAAPQQATPEKVTTTKSKKSRRAARTPVQVAK